MKPLRTIASVLLLSLAATVPAMATLVPKLSAAELDALADRVVVVRCTGTAVQSLEPLAFPVTEWTFDVLRVDAGEELAARVAGGDRRLLVRQAGGATEDGRSWSIPGMPSYEVGAYYRLHLNGDSELGLTSPVGLGQGVERLDPTSIPGLVQGQP